MGEIDTRRWQRIDALFAAALELPESERRRFLEQECDGDEQMLQELQELLANDAGDEDDGFLEHGSAVERRALQLHRRTPQPDDLPVQLLTPFEEVIREGGESAPRSWGPFELLELLGEGGMGRVFKARDTRLQRLVAVKVLHRIGPQLAKRLAREARAQARINHPNVCTVYEVGELQEIPYIAMQLIDGESLQTAAASLTPEQKVLLLGQVADAVHAAHQNGIIHRDLKPANVLVEELEDGALKPYVLDFGLARETGEASLTASGEMLGTPGYMAPEQIEGGFSRADRRSDVFSLGASLYSILAGQQPFAGDTKLAVLVATMHGDPVPLRQRLPAVPADLEAIVMRCLERRPDDRYPSARSLAEDLRRYLNGEPVSARPSGLWRRMVKTARRHRIRVVAAAAVTLALLVLSGLWLQARLSARAQASLALRFGQEIERIEGVHWKARSLERHDMRPTNEMIRKRLADLEQEINRHGKNAAGPGHTALGRGFLALGDFEAARKHLETAWNGGYQSSETAYALGVTLSQQYRSKLKELSQDRPGDGLEREYEAAIRQYRDPAREYLETVAPASFDAPEYVEALLAASEGSHERAIELSSTVLEQRPWFYEAGILEGEVLTERAMTQALSRLDKEALDGYKAALAAFNRVLRIARSDVRAYEGACSAVVAAQRFETYLGISVDEDFQDAVDTCKKGLVVEAHDHIILTKMSVLYSYWSLLQFSQGADPTSSIEESLKVADSAVEAGGSLEDNRSAQALSLLCLGLYQSMNHDNPTGSYLRGIEYASEALAADESDEESLNTLAVLYHAVGTYDVSEETESRSYLSKAAELYERFSALYPASPVGPANAGNAYVDLETYGTSLDVEERERILQKAAALLSTALSRDPKHEVAYLYMGLLRLRMANLARMQGNDPRSALFEAITALRHAVMLNGRVPLNHAMLAKAYQELAESQIELGLSPEESMHRARIEMEKAGSVMPGILEKYHLEEKQAQLEQAMTSSAQH